MLHAVNLNLYRCRNCGWQRIGRLRDKKIVITVGRRPSIKKYLLYGLVLAAGIYTAAILFTPFGGQYALNGPTGEPITATAPATAPAPVEAPPLVPQGEFSEEPPTELPIASAPVAAPAASAPTATPQASPAAVAPPAAVTPPAEAPKVIVVANRDSKLYHLPGMRYYKGVAAYHRLEFSSEEEAIKAGYRKAPR